MAIEENDERDISEVIEDAAAELESADSETELEASVNDKEEPEVEETEEPAAELETAEETPVDSVDEPAVIEAPENWDSAIREAFGKVDANTQEVWLNQHKDFQRGFNNVAQEAAQLRRVSESNQPVYDMIAEVAPSWKAQGMTVEQGLGQILQLGKSYAADPAATLLHLAKMAGLDLNEIGAEAPYRTSDDIARDNRMQGLEQRLAQQDKVIAERRQNELQGEIAAFQAETDAEGNLAHPYFNETMETIGQMYRNGYSGSLEQAYDQVTWTTPVIRDQMLAGQGVAKIDQNRNAAAKKAEAASSQRVKKARPAPSTATDLDDLSTDDLVARIAADMQARA